MMRYRVILAAVVSVFLWTISYGAENIYTWRDKNGVLNITDQAPPDGVEILDVSPSYRKKAAQQEQSRQVRRQKSYQYTNQKILQQKADQARKQEAEALQRADELYSKAQAASEVKGKRKKKRRFYRRARRYQKQAEEAVAQAERAAKQAEKYEKQLSR